MPLLQEPFLGGSYGWTTGESGWGSPMNENLLRFSILHNRRIDSIEATLPLSPSDGDAHFVTADNQLYYRVGGQWYFTSVPVGFELIEKITEKHYRFNGTSIEEIDTVEELKENKADIVSSITTVPTFSDLATTPAAVGQVVQITGVTVAGDGGGQYVAKSGSVSTESPNQINSATASIYWSRINNAYQKSIGADRYYEASIATSDETTANIDDKKISSYAIGFDESSSLSADYSYTSITGEGSFSTIPADNRGWLAAANGTNWVEVVMPFGVIIGDSIAEGHPAQHGRLHQSYGTPTFNDAILNVYGTPAYALSQRTGMHWYNAGIGGQTTTEILARFSRDALGETVVVGDGRPDTTLPAKPVWIWVNAGINDVSALTSTSTTKSNLLKMALLAKKAGVQIGFNTIGPVNAHNSTQRGMQDDINEFILTVLPLYGCYTFDFHSWFVDPADSTSINPLFDADGVHPNEIGYNNYVARLLSDCTLPIYCNGFFIESLGDSYSANYREPTSLEFEDESGSLGVFSIADQFGFFNPKRAPLTNTIMRVYVRNVSGGVDGSKHSGISNITAAIGYVSQKESSSVRYVEFGGQLAKVSGTWQLLTSLVEPVGIASISVNTTDITINFDSVIKNPIACYSGSTTPRIVSVVPQGTTATSMKVRLFNSSTLALIDPTVEADNVAIMVRATGIE